MKLRFTTNHIISCGSIEPFCILYYRVFLYVCQSATCREMRTFGHNIRHFALGNTVAWFVISVNRKSCFFYANPASGRQERAVLWSILLCRISYLHRTKQYKKWWYSTAHSLECTRLESGRNITDRVVRGWMRKNDLVMPKPTDCWHG